MYARLFHSKQKVRRGQRAMVMVNLERRALGLTDGHTDIRRPVT